MSAELSPEVQQVITSGRVAHLTTLCPDGSPHTTILWVGLDGNDIVVGKMAVSPPLIISTCLDRGDARWHSTACSPKPHCAVMFSPWFHRLPLRWPSWLGATLRRLFRHGWRRFCSKVEQSCPTDRR